MGRRHGATWFAIAAAVRYGTTCDKETQKPIVRASAVRVVSEPACIGHFGPASPNFPPEHPWMLVASYLDNLPDQPRILYVPGSVLKVVEPGLYNVLHPSPSSNDVRR